MPRKFKVLGFALVAVGAMSAVMASAAPASSYTGSSYPTAVTGSNISGRETFTTPGGTVQCDTHFLSPFYLNAIGSTLELFPTYTNCVAFGFLNATVDVMGCVYQLHAGAAQGGGVYNNSFDIVCRAGNGPITIKAGTCVVDVPAQTGLTNVKTTNSGTSVTVQPEVTNITMNVTTDGFGCPFPGTGHQVGSYHGDVVLSRLGGGSFSVSGV
jgi:hypothetical protein